MRRNDEPCTLCGQPIRPGQPRTWYQVIPTTMAPARADDPGNRARGHLRCVQARRLPNQSPAAPVIAGPCELCGLHLVGTAAAYGEHLNKCPGAGGAIRTAPAHQPKEEHPMTPEQPTTGAPYVQQDGGPEAEPGTLAALAKDRQRQVEADVRRAHYQSGGATPICPPARA